MKTTSQTPQVFSFQHHPLQAHIDKNGNLWFVAQDVCSILGLNNVSEATRRLDPDEKLVSVLPRPGQSRAVLQVSESGLYKLIMGSNKPEAKQFTKWVTSEMLPAIRKTGHYEVPGKALPAEKKLLPEKRNHNRLDKDRLISILADVCLIDDSNLRERLRNKLIGGDNGFHS